MNNIQSSRSQGGFTLVELIAVLVILGILAAFAVPRFVNLQDQAAASGIASNISGWAATQFASDLASPPPGKTDDWGPDENAVCVHIDQTEHLDQWGLGENVPAFNIVTGEGDASFAAPGINDEGETFTATCGIVLDDDGDYDPGAGE